MPRPLETYEQAVEYLYARINYERVPSQSYSVGDFKLNRMQRLLELLGNPHEQIPVVHIAGTKGKGSTAAMVARVLSEAGYVTGLFTSPHISAFEERMTVCGVMPTSDEVVALVNRMVEPVALLDRCPEEMNPTYFEITTAMAWLYFAQKGVQLAVLEVGLGGRLDSTNVCRPAVCVITSISRDHTQLLGNEISQIAGEKAGIIKPGVPVVSGALHPEALRVIEQVSRERGAPLFQRGRDFDFTTATDQSAAAAGIVKRTINYRCGECSLDALPVPLRGAHQAHNTALAVTVIERLRDAGWCVEEQALRRGLQEVHWPARIEVLQERPTIVVDAAHNWASIRALLETLESDFAPRARTLVFAATRDKDVAGMLRQLLPRFDTVILTSYLNNPRALAAEQLLELARSLSDLPVHMAHDPGAAWKLACRLSGPEDLICVTGSFFIAAEMRELILDGRDSAIRLSTTSTVSAATAGCASAEADSATGQGTLPAAQNGTV